MLLFSALLLAAVVIYVMSPEERMRLLRTAVALLRELKEAVTRRYPASDGFYVALRARQQYAIVTTVLVAVNIACFVCAVFGAGRLGDPQTLLSWGGNVGPRTTNGEWWRLITSSFVHSGFFHLLINMTALVQLGVILERLVGRVLFATVYVMAGIFAGLAAVAAYPIDVSVGASASICGLLGLLAATSIWLRRHPCDIRIPWIVIIQLSPVVALFTIWNLFNGDMPLRGEFVSFIAGMVGGLALTTRVHEAQPPVRRVVGVASLAAGLAVAFAIPVRGLADVRPEVGGLMALEQRTASAYELAVERFKKGRLSGEALAQMIAQAIVPQLEAADAHLKSVRRVPQIHELLVADARDYLRLRTQSWQLRAEGLRSMNRAPERQSSYVDPAASARSREHATALYRATTRTLARAEAAERASLAALERTRQDTADPANHP